MASLLSVRITLKAFLLSLHKHPCKNRGTYKKREGIVKMSLLRKLFLWLKVCRLPIIGVYRIAKTFGAGVVVVIEIRVLAFFAPLVKTDDMVVSLPHVTTFSHPASDNDRSASSLPNIRGKSLRNSCSHHRD